MYTANELAKMYNVSNKTIYSKFKHESIKDYVTNTKKGLRLEQEGFNTFQLLMAESKSNNRVTVESSQSNSSVKDEYINTLKEQIEYLKKDKDNLQEQNVKLLNQLEKHVLLLNQAQNDVREKTLLLENKNNKSFWQKIFKHKN